MEITGGKYVTLSYELYVGAEDDLWEKTTPEAPLAFVYGIGEMLASFEDRIRGLKAGDQFDFTLPCLEAYGEYDDASVIDLPKNMFEVDGKFDTEVIFEGNIIPLMDNEGNRFNAQVIEITEEQVKVDLNHPMAGEDLHFKGEIIGVRDASEEEINARFNGGGCGCGCDCDCDDEEGDCSSKGCGGCGH